MLNVYVKTVTYAESYITFRANLSFAYCSVQYTKAEVLEHLKDSELVVRFFETCGEHWVVSTHPKGFVDGNAWKLRKDRNEAALALNLLSALDALHKKHVCMWILLRAMCVLQRVLQRILQRVLQIVHNDLHPGNVLIHPQMLSVILIDFGMAGASFVETDNNTFPEHDYNEMLWHFLFSWDFSPQFVNTIKRALMPCSIVGPGDLKRDVVGKWVDNDAEFEGTVCDKMPVWAQFYPHEERILTRYGHNQPMYPRAVIHANSAVSEGEFQGLLLDGIEPQKARLTWLPPEHEVASIIQSV